jgi:hypothetical protein
MPVFIGIDYHKAYSVYSVLDVQGESLGRDVSITLIRRISARWCDDGRDAAWSLKRV